MNSISWIRPPQTRLPKTKCNFKINKRKNLSSDQVKSRTAKLKYSRVKKKTSPKRKSHINSWNMSFLCKKYFSKKNPGKIEQQQEKKSKLFLNRKKSEIFFDNSGKWEIFFCIFLTYFLVLVTRQISMQNPESAQKNFKKISN